MKHKSEAKGAEEHGRSTRDSPAEGNVLQELGDGHDLDTRAEEEETEVRLGESLEVGCRATNRPLVHVEALEADTIAFLLEGKSGRDLDDFGRRVKDGDADRVVACEEDRTQRATSSKVDSRREGSTDHQAEQGRVGALENRDGDIVRDAKASDRKSSENASQVAAREVSRLRDEDAPLADARVDEDLHGMQVDDQGGEGANLTNREGIVAQELLLEVSGDEAVRDAKNESNSPAGEHVLQGVGAKVETTPRKCERPGDHQRDPPDQE